MLQFSCCNCTKAQSVDALRVQARNALLEGAQSGKLMEARKTQIFLGSGTRLENS